MNKILFIFVTFFLLAGCEMTSTSYKNNDNKNINKEEGENSKY